MNVPLMNVPSICGQDRGKQEGEGHVPHDPLPLDA